MLYPRHAAAAPITTKDPPSPPLSPLRLLWELKTAPLPPNKSSLVFRSSTAPLGLSLYRLSSKPTSDRLHALLSPSPSPPLIFFILARSRWPLPPPPDVLSSSPRPELFTGLLYPLFLLHRPSLSPPLPSPALPSSTAARQLHT